MYKRQDYVNAFKAGLDKIWFNQAVKFDFTADLTGRGNRQVLCINIRHYQTVSSIVSCIGLGWLGPNFSTCSRSGWVGSHEMDPWTTLGYPYSAGFGY